MIDGFGTLPQVDKLEPPKVLLHAQTSATPFLRAHQTTNEAQPKHVLQAAEHAFDCDVDDCQPVGIPAWEAMPAVLKRISLAFLQPLSDDNAFGGDLARAYSNLSRALVEDPPNLLRVRSVCLWVLQRFMKLLVFGC